MGEDSTYITNRLSIFILQDGFSFLVKNEHSTVIAFENFKLTGSTSVSELLQLIKSKINSEWIVNRAIKTLEVIYGNPQFSLVPIAYFEESHLPHYLKYSSKLIEGDDFSYDEITTLGVKTVYIPYININNYFFDIFGSFEFTHIMTNLLNKAFWKSNTAKEFIKIHVSHQLIYFTAFRDQKLLLSNAFSFETAQDFAYYVLFTIEELKLDREELHMEFSGYFFNTEENPSLQILSTYIRHISFSNEIAPVEFDHKIGFHEHFNII